jgi:DNA invertase Pin-like site-specific DNA recombinase
MSKVHYIRVSTVEQNTNRQKENIIMGAQVFEDKISGSVEFSKRPKGKELLAAIEKGLITEVNVHSIDRLGRSNLDILQTIQYMTSKGVNVVSNKEGLQTIIDGKENMTAKLMIGILSTLAEFELSRLKERQAEGIEAAKNKGSYKSNGRTVGSNESIEDFMKKATTKKIVRYLKEGNSLRRTAKLSECSLGTVQKVHGILNSKSE